HGQIIAVRFHVEEEARAPVERAAHYLESHRDLAVLEIVDALVDGDREIGERLHALDELLVARTVQLPALLGATAGPLPARPHPNSLTTQSPPGNGPSTGRRPHHHATPTANGQNTTKIHGAATGRTARGYPGYETSVNGVGGWRPASS